MEANPMSSIYDIKSIMYRVQIAPQIKTVIITIT